MRVSRSAFSHRALCAASLRLGIAVLATLGLVGAPAAQTVKVNVIDVVVGVTEAAVAAWSSWDDILDDIKTEVDSANDSFRNNNDIPLQVRLAGVFRVTGYDESAKTNDQVLTDLTTPVPALKIVATRRQQLGADVAMLVISNPAQSAAKGKGTDCGVSKQAPPAELAFSVLYQGCVGHATPRQYVLAHELGHILGAEHDPANTTKTDNGYGYGYQDPKGRFRTIMAYECPGTQKCPRVKYWSSATTTYRMPGTRSDLPLGDATTYDNEGKLRDNGPRVAAFAAYRAAKFMFATEGTYDGNLGGLGGADAKCQQEADNAGLPGTYWAWLSTESLKDSPSKAFTKSAGPYIATDSAGTVIAADWAALTTSGPVIEILTPSGKAADSGGYVWTATAHDGTPTAYVDAYDCKGWTKAGDGGSGNFAIRQAPPFANGRNWSNTGNVLSCSSKLRLYCVGQ